MRCLIPARAGSKRIPGKNTRLFAGKPLVSWTIETAKAVFGEVYVSTDDDPVCYLAEDAGCTVIERPDKYATDDSPDIEWVLHALKVLKADPQDDFCLLRPTSPLRGVSCVRRALGQWERSKAVLDSLRAVRVAEETAWKQWTAQPHMPGLMIPVTGYYDRASRPTQTLPITCIQTAALEMFWARVIYDGSLSGTSVGMFMTQGAEALDINTEQDWAVAEAAVDLE